MTHLRFVKPNSPYFGQTLEAMVDTKRASRMARVDAMPPEMRALVNEYGLNVVIALNDAGVTKPKHIRHIVETVLDEFSPTRGSFAKQGIRTEVAP